MNHFRIPTPATISLSGGRTSAYMLRRILDAHDGGLPDDVAVLFANTGKEFPETLDFVRDISTHWGVEIHWVEYDQKAEHKFRAVTHATASRKGEPFEALINAKKYLPNQAQRLCTETLKVLTMHRYREHALGMPADSFEIIGIRADEPRRAAKIRARIDRGEPLEIPLVDAGVTKQDVMAFWSKQPFDLKLRQGESNCDLCFLKGADLRVRIMQDHPYAAAWWVERERERGALFVNRGPRYSELESFAKRQIRLPMFEEHGFVDCMCTD